MRNEIYLRSLRKIFFLTVLTSIPTIYGVPCVNPPVSWNNSTVSTDVDNADLVISGFNVISGPVHINATTCDVVVTVSAGDAFVRAQDSNGRLYLNAATGFSITFELSDNLTFLGSSNATKDPLFMMVQGGGDVSFRVAGNKAVTFSSRSGLLGATYGGVKFFVLMDASNPSTLEFSRFDCDLDQNDDVSFVVGPQSWLGYLAVTPATNNPTETATIVFDPTLTTAGTGATVLRVQDGGSFVMSGRLVADVVDPKFSDVDLSVLAGLTAEVLVENTLCFGGDAFAALRVENFNTECTQLVVDPFCEEVFTGSQFGFILGPYATLTVGDLSYLDYIGLANNTCCTFTVFNACDDAVVTQRLRNGSAFIVDGVDNLVTVNIDLQGNSAIYFRSGIDSCGNVSSDFTVQPNLRAFGAGNVVFDVEGALNVNGDVGGHSALNILSLQVTATGCPVLINDNETQFVFPKRTFNRDAFGRYFAYNAGAMLINNRVNLFDTTLLHTDENHNVYANGNLGRCDLASEPTYVGGDSYTFPCKQTCLQLPLNERPLNRPLIAFYNSEFRIHTNVASAGVDFRVPNNPNGGVNLSEFIFYNNGRCIDNGFGRNMILGTDAMFDGCCFTTLDRDSHLDIFQDTAQDSGSTVEQLSLQVDYNTNCITEGIVGNITGQNAVQSIFLNNASNISIGTNNVSTVPCSTAQGVDYQTCELFTPYTLPTLLVDGAFFTFGTRGGDAGLPDESGVTGQGGIFVDQNGIFTVTDDTIVSIGTMVTKSGNGIVNLPPRSVYFDSGVGITQWQPDLNCPNQLVLVGPNDCLSDYTLDWPSIIKDYCSQNPFVPYDPTSTPGDCDCPPVTAENLQNLPVIQGRIDQLQILRSRIGDQAEFIIDGGYVGELVFLQSPQLSAAAPVAFVVLTNNAYLGLGTAHRNYDSLNANVVLGVNGVMLVVDEDPETQVGNSVVELNEDVIINNVCHILPGPNFGANGPDTLTIYSTLPKELRVKSGGTLDLSMFTNPNQILQIAGNVSLVLEPNSRLIMGGGLLVFTDEAQLLIDRAQDQNRPTGTSVASTNKYRAILSGTGEIIMKEASAVIVHQGAYFGVETYPQCSDLTDIVWTLNDQSQFLIGNDEFPGGTFQIGDTGTQDGSIFFQLIIDGIGANFQIGRQGFFGLGAGIVDKSSDIPNDWLSGCLCNVEEIGIFVDEGTFRHNQIASGASSLASLFAIGSAAADAFTFNFDNSLTNILGGGNFARIIDCGDDMIRGLPQCPPADETVCPFGASPIAIEVTTINGVIGRYEVGLMSSKPLLTDKSNPIPPSFVNYGVTDVSASTLFQYLVTLPYSQQGSPKADISTNQLNVPILGFVFNDSTIQRQNYFRILSGESADPISPIGSYQIGAVYINIDDATGDINNVIAIQIT